MKLKQIQITICSLPADEPAAECRRLSQRQRKKEKMTMKVINFNTIAVTLHYIPLHHYILHSPAGNPHFFNFHSALCNSVEAVKKNTNCCNITNATQGNSRHQTNTTSKKYN